MIQKGDIERNRQGTGKEHRQECKEDIYVIENDLCPHQRIVNYYHEILPELRHVKIWNNSRRGYLRARWREDPGRQNLDWWRRFFEYVKRSDFLMGREKDWQADLEWLIKPKNFVKVIEGNYENRQEG